MSDNFAAHYLEEIQRQLRGHKRLAESAITQLNDEELFRVIDPESNSVAVIMKHMGGNLYSRFRDFLTSDGEKPDRHRDTEFEVQATTRQQITEVWERGWKTAFDNIAALRPEDLSRTVTIRNEPHTVVQACNRALAHMAQHTGQIVFLAKHLKSKDWKTLSIPRGQSQNFMDAKKAEKFKHGHM